MVKYHIKTSKAEGRNTPPPKIASLPGDYCLHCPSFMCVKYTSCAYDVEKKRGFDVKSLADTGDYLCKGCLRCLQECYANSIDFATNPEYLMLGDEYYTPEIITSTYEQAETGKIPVSGGGYSGRFTGSGFDSMWTDMSEIVRPTRDGIHGREYISTSWDLGRKLKHLEFSNNGELLVTQPKTINLPIPIIFNTLSFGPKSKNITEALVEAASSLNTYVILDELYEGKNIIPLVEKEIPSGFNIIEFMDSEDILEKIKGKDLISIVRVNGNTERILELAKGGVSGIHIGANWKNIKDVIRKAHLALVEEGLRDEVSLIVSGGIGDASHLAKAIICGADCCAIDIPLLLALECRLCKRCLNNLSCPVEIENVDIKWAIKRIVNLMGAWHSQLIEIMGAMGIREVRRMRGEVKRAIFFEEIDREFREYLYQKAIGLEELGIRD